MVFDKSLVAAIIVFLIKFFYTLKFLKSINNIENNEYSLTVKQGQAEQ